MPTPTIAEMLKYANLQMAAEALYTFKAKTDPNQAPGDLLTSTGHFNLALTADILTTGNEHATRFAPTEAAAFAAQWEVVDHISNTTTGFSGTLFKDKVTGELVMSFRSTEFIDDVARDCVATNTLEIKAYGFAFGQIADMEAWYAKLKSNGTLPASAKLDVTGYSLGGHLATAFNQLHQNDLNGGQVVTFNGAGVGQLKSGANLGSVIAEFNTLRTTPAAIAALFTDPRLRDVYLALSSRLKNGEPVMPSDYTLLDSIAPDQLGSEYQQQQFADDKSWIRSALDRIKTIQTQVARISLGLVTDSVDGAPAKIPDQNIAQENFDYQMAVLKVQEKTTAMSTLGGALNALSTKTYATPGLTNQFDIVGRETTTSATAMVSNSQWHYGTNVDVFIEDQPMTRGSFTVFDAQTYWDVGGLVPINEYSKNDFGDTHSLVLLVDSLNIQNTLKTLDPTVSSGTLNNVLKAASSAKAERVQGGDGHAEGDVLENILNSLSKQLLGANATQLVAKLNGNTWADIGDRTAFYNQLKALTDSDAFKALAGTVTLALPDADMATKARTDFSAFLTLQTLSPFILKATTGNETVVENALKTKWNTAFQDWKADQDLTPDQRTRNEGNYTNLYLADRAAMLTWVIKAQTENTAFDDKNLKSSASAGQLQNAIWDFVDKESGETVFVTPSDLFAINPDRRRVVFGGSEGDSLNGYDKDDHLYGGAGNDQIDGAAGADYLEGNADADILTGGLGRDTLLGGTGNDTLEGGKESDLLNGGLGDDTYKFTGGDGWDWLEDKDGVGHIEYDGLTLGAQTIKKIAPSVWQEQNGSATVTYSLYDRSENNEIYQVLAIQGQNGGMWVKRWSAGQLGITLPDAIPVANPVLAKDIYGDPLIHSATISNGAESIDWRVVKQYNFQYEPDYRGINILVAYDVDYYLVDAQGNPIEGGGPARVDTLYDSAANDHIRAGAQDDSIQATNGGDNLIEAGAGRDRVTAGTGKDVILGGADADILQGGAGNDRIYADTQIDIDLAIAQGNQQTGSGLQGDALIGDSGDDTLIAGADNDALSGGFDDDVLIAGAGNDLLAGGEGDDILLGGAGDDLLFGSGSYEALDANWSVFFDQTLDRLQFQSIEGYPFSGGGGADLLRGGAGNDWLFGGAVADQLFGDEGDDQLYGDAGDDTLSGGEGGDVLFGDTTQSATPPVGAVAEWYNPPQYHGNDILEGGAGNDHLWGAGGSDELYGGDGDDQLVGDSNNLAIAYHGVDLLYGGDGNDSLFGYGKNDQLYGGAGDDFLSGDSGGEITPADHGDDLLDGGDGNDTLNGNGGNDFLLGGLGNDRLYGDSDDIPEAFQGDDTLDGGAGDDYLRGYGGNDILIGGAGKDELLAEAGDDSLDGGEEDDVLDGGDGNDLLSGGAGSDGLVGGAGNDTLTGGTGTDNLWGGGGDDTYIFRAGDGAATAGGVLEALHEESGKDSVRFEGVSAGSLKVSEANGGVGLLVEYGASDKLFIVGGGTGAVENFEVGSEKLTTTEFIGRYSDSAMSGVNADGYQVITGGRAGDALAAAGGHATLSGGRGDDVITTAGGNNTFLYSLGDGSDRIIDTSQKLDAQGAAQPNTLRFGVGITPADIGLTAQGSTLMLKVGSGDGDVIRIDNFNAADPLAKPVIDRFEFEDGGLVLSFDALLKQGITLEGTAVSDILTGAAGNDTLDGGAGDDFLAGGDGADTYRFKLGSGKDTVIDGGSSINTIQLATGMTFGTLHATWDGSDLLLTNRAAGDQMRLRDYTNGGQQWQLRSDDGSTLSLMDFLALPASEGSAQVAQLWADTRLAAQLEVMQDEVAMYGYSVGGLSFARYAGDALGTFTQQTVTSRFFDPAIGYSDLGVQDYNSATLLWDQYGVRQWLTHFVDQRTESNAELITVSNPYSFSVSSSTQLLTVNIDPEVISSWTDFSTNHYASRFDPQTGAVTGWTYTYSDNVHWIQDVTVTQGVPLPLNWTAPLKTLVGTQVAASVELIEQEKTYISEVVVGDGNNTIRADNGIRDLVDGGAGNDAIYGDNKDLLYGNDGGDWIVGAADSQTLIGGRGNDFLDGKDGADRYCVLNEDGIDEVFDSGTPGSEITLPSVAANNYAALESYYGNGIDVDTVVFGPGITAANLRVTGSEDAGFMLLQQPDGTGVRVRLAQNSDVIGTGIEQVEFDDGSRKSIRQMIASMNAAHDLSGTDGDDEIHLGDGDDIVRGLSGFDNLDGGRGNDTIDGGDNDDVLFGGKGDDFLSGGNGDDNYYFSLGDGRDRIDNTADDNASAVDQVCFSAGILPTSIALTAQGFDLIIRISASDSITVVNYFSSDGAHKIDAIYFADGNSFWDQAEIELHIGAGDDVLTGTTAADTIHGFAGNDTISGGDGNDSLYGDEGSDTLNGDAGNDLLDGGTGADKMKGGAGNDIYVVDNTGDIVTEAANEGTDTVQSSVTYTLSANVENLTLTGTAAIKGTGNALNNVLKGNSAANTLAGGAGNDTYYVSTGDVVTEAASAGTDTVIADVAWTLGSNIENLTLTGTTAINGTGNTLANVLTGNAGNNTLSGGTGADTMLGGLGNDTYVVDNTADIITEASNEGTDLVQASVTTTLYANVENLTLTGSAAINGTGNAADNVLTGNSANNTLNGGDGNDTLNGGSGSDTMVGGLGDDLYVVNVSTDVVTEAAGAGNDTVQSSVTLTLGSNVENLLLTGTTAINGTGNTLTNLVRGNSAVNTLNGGAGNDILEGGTGNDTLTDTAGTALFNGGAGADTITGGAGAEIFLGGLGNDTYTTGAGNDIVLFNKGDGQDTFVTGGTGSDTVSLGGGVLYSDLSFSKATNDLVLKVGASDQITFKNWYATTPSKPVLNLQMMAEAMADFAPGGADPLRDQKVEAFNFAGLAGAFDTARTANPGLTSWALTNALLNFQLAGSDSAALGGDLAYQYGKNGTLAGIGITPAFDVLNSAALGASAQALTPLAGLQSGSQRLS
jgi:Ca2+-binding RTX toxin-like protein